MRYLVLTSDELIDTVSQTLDLSPLSSPRALIQDCLSEMDRQGWTFVSANGPNDAGVVTYYFSCSDSYIRMCATLAKAERTRVTTDGFTKLPDAMVKELCPDASPVWFVKGKDTWEAWREGDLEKMLSGKMNR